MFCYVMIDHVKADIDWPIPSSEFDFHEMDFPMGGELKPKSKVHFCRVAMSQN